MRLQPSDPTSSDTPIRVGLVGVGNWARHGHIRVLGVLPAYQLSVVYSQRRENAEQTALEFGFKHVAGSLEELVGHPEVDLVVVLTTAPQHEQAVRAAIAAKKNVYCEWPLTTATRASEELAELAKAAGVRHMVGLQRRLAPHNRYLRDLLDEGYAGELRSVRLHVSTNDFRATRSTALRWTAPIENFSSVIAIYAGHFLDMLFATVGWPASLSSIVISQFPLVTLKESGEVLPSTAPDQMVMIGQLPNGAVLSVHIEGGKRNGSGVQLDITGHLGDLRVSNRSAFGDLGHDYVIEGSSGDNQPLQVLPVPPSYNRLPESDLPSAVLELAELYASYAEDIRHGHRNAPDFADAVRMHKLIDACVLSSTEGVSVRLD